MKIDKSDINKIIETAEELISRYKAFHVDIDNINDLGEYDKYIIEKVKNNGSCILCQTAVSICEREKSNFHHCKFCIYNLDKGDDYWQVFRYACSRGFPKSFDRIYEYGELYPFDKDRIKNAILERIYILENLIIEEEESE